MQLPFAVVSVGVLLTDNVETACLGVVLTACFDAGYSEAFGHDGRANSAARIAVSQVQLGRLRAFGSSPSPRRPLCRTVRHPAATGALLQRGRATFHRSRVAGVKPATATRRAEVAAAQTMITRTAEAFGLESHRLAADTGYGPAEMLAWPVHGQGIGPQRNGGGICATSRCSTSQNARAAPSRATPFGSIKKVTPTPARLANACEDTFARLPCRWPGQRATTPCATGRQGRAWQEGRTR